MAEPTPGAMRAADELIERMQLPVKYRNRLIEVIDRAFAEELRRLRGCLRHAVQRNHPHRPHSCAGCQAIERELEADILIAHGKTG